jgi:hypothetical protein
VKFFGFFLMLDLRFSQRWLWRVSSSGIWRHVVHWVSTDVSEEHIASIFRVEEIDSANHLRACWFAEPISSFLMFFECCVMLLVVLCCLLFWCTAWRWLCSIWMGTVIYSSLYRLMLVWATDECFDVELRHSPCWIGGNIGSTDATKTCHNLNAYIFETNNLKVINNTSLDSL